MEKNNWRAHRFRIAGETMHEMVWYCIVLLHRSHIFVPIGSVIPGGSCDECTYMSGILFRKTGTNKQMPREIINPKIMVSVWVLDSFREELALLVW
jgi:hypothetical protein